MANKSDTVHEEMTEIGELLRRFHLSGKSAVSLETTEPDYVLDIDSQARDEDNTDPLVAATSSSYTIRLFSLNTLTSTGQIIGHKSVITGLRFSHQDNNLLYSSSQDSTIRCWDLRSPKKAVQTFEGYEETNNIFTSFDVSCDDRVICAGTEATKEDVYLLFWDSRQRGRLGCYSESHQDDITTVQFHPSSSDSLASGSTDGLICIYDISQSTEDDALLSTLNSCSSVQRIGWCGPDDRSIYCVTHIDTFHVWNAFEGDNLIEILDVKEKLKEICDIDYLVDCVAGISLSPWNPVLLAGTHSGDIQLLEVDNCGSEVSQVSSLTNGHTATVRCQLWNKQSRTLVTGGEDSVLCLWSTSPTGSPGKSSPSKHAKMKAKVKSSVTKKSKPY